MATRLFIESQDSSFRQNLSANPLRLFLIFSDLGKEPFSISEVQECSKCLEHAMWISDIEGHADYTCLCTDASGVVKNGYWTSLKWLARFMEDRSFVFPKTEAEATDILSKRRQNLFEKFFSPADVEFIMNTIPLKTVLK